MGKKKSKAEKRMRRLAKECRERKISTPDVTVDGRWRKIGDIKSSEVYHEFSQWKNRDLFDLYFLVLEEMIEMLQPKPEQDIFKCVEMIEANPFECIRDVKYRGTEAQVFAEIISEMVLNKEDKVWANIEVKNNGDSINFSTFIMEDGNTVFMEDWAILGGNIYRANYAIGEDFPDVSQWIEDKKIAV